MCGEIAVALIVRQNDDHIGTLLGRTGHGESRQRDERAD